jgi:hypothetical protein
VDVGFSDLFKDVDGALMFEIGARKDRIGFYFDPIFAQLSDDVMGPLGGNINSKVDLGIVDAAFTYQLMRNHRFDFLAGLRYYALDVTIELPTGMNGEGDENWVDVIVGVQYRDTFAKKWFYFLRGNIGAGGSEFSWDVLASIGYRFNDLFSLSLGGRALDVDYEEASEGFLFDARMSGVSLNFGFHF